MKRGEGTEGGGERGRACKWMEEEREGGKEEEGAERRFGGEEREVS